MKRFRILQNMWILFLLILFVGCLTGCGQGQKETVEPVSESVKQEENSASKNVLLNTYGYIVPGSELDRAEIGSITFLSTTADAPDTAWEAGDGTGSVLAWTESGDNGLLDLYFAGEGGVWAPEDSINLFADYNHISEIHFNDSFITSDIKTMQAMFVFGMKIVPYTDENGREFGRLTYEPCQLKNLDLSSFDTSNVTDMSLAFAGLMDFEDLDLSNFDFSAVESANSMFEESIFETVRLPKAFAGIKPEVIGLPADTQLQFSDSDPDSYCSDNQGAFLSRLFSQNVMTPIHGDNGMEIWPEDLVPMSDIPRKDVIMIKVLDSLDQMPTNAWDMSRDQDGSVMAWVKTLDNGFHELYIAGEGGVWAPEKCEYLFANYTNAVKIDFGNAFHTNLAADMTDMFRECTSLLALDLSGFDTSNVWSMTMMFKECQKLEHLDLSSFDTSNLEYAMQMFSLYGWNDIGGFSISSRMESLDLRSFDWSSIRSDQGGADSIFLSDLRTIYTSSPLPDAEYPYGFDTVMVDKPQSESAPMEEREPNPNTLFSEPGYVPSALRNNSEYYLEEIDTLLGNTSAFGTPICRNSITSITFLSDLVDAPADAWDVSEGHDGTVLAWITGKSGDYAMTIASDGGVYAPADSTTLFGGFQNLKKINWNDAFHTDSVENMEGMFYACKSLKELDLSFFDTAGTSDMSHMFKHCYGLEKLDISSFHTSKVRDMAEMFAVGISSSKTISPDGGMSFADEKPGSLKALNLSHFDTSNVEDMYAMFMNCASLEKLDISSFKTSRVTDMCNMFYGCKTLAELDVSNFDTANVTDMKAMFRDCSRVSELNISGFDTSKVTDMWSMFTRCKNIETLDVSGFDTSNVTDMASMFLECEMVEYLDVSHFDTANVTDMRSMFDYCCRMEMPDVSNFDTSNVTDMGYMFRFCSILDVGDNPDTLDLSNFNTDKLKHVESMFAGCIGLKTVNLGDFDFTEAVNSYYKNAEYLDKNYGGRLDAFADCYVDVIVTDVNDVTAKYLYEQNGIASINGMPREEWYNSLF